MTSFLVICSICLAAILAILRLREREFSNIATSDQRSRISATVAEKTRPLLQDLDQLRRDNRRLAIANAAQDGYLSGLNSELRRPLGEIAGLADSLLSDPRAFGLSPDQQDRIRGIAERNAGMTAMLDRVGGIAELSGAGFHVRPERVDPRWIAHDVVSALKSRADVRSVSLHLADRAAGLSVEADPLRLRQMLLNLLTYAIHDSAPESGIRLSFDEDPAGVMLTLTAPGVVLSDGQIARLFETPTPEFQSDFNLIGTALSRGVAEAMGGAVQALRDPSGGLRIEITLPAARPSAEPKAPDMSEANLLLVTADAVAAAALRRNVQPFGGRLFVVETGEDPVAVARDLRPDAILIDAYPVADAFRLKAVLDAAAIARTLPVIGLVSVHTPWDERLAREAGFTAWTPWPVQPGAVRRVMGLVADVSAHREAA